MRHLRQLLNDSVIYGLGGAFSKSIALLTLPILTRIFSPKDFGEIEMLSVIGSLLAAGLNLGLDSAQSKFFFKEKKVGKNSQRSVVSAVFQWHLTVGTFAVALATLTGPVINVWLFEGSLKPIHFAVTFVSVLLTQLLSQSVEVLRLLYRPWSYVLINLFQSALAVSLILLL